MNKLKKQIGIFLICAMLFCMICAAPFTAAENPPIGDADVDGTVTIVDATAIQRVLAGLPVSSFDNKAADVDADGILTIIDATCIQRILAGLPMPGQPALDHTFTIDMIQKHGNIVLSVKATEFLALGYEYGDLLTVTINGTELTMPVGSEYSDVDQGKMICRVEISEVTGDDNVILAINLGDLATALDIAEKEKIDESPGYVWRYKVAEPVAVRISLKEKGGSYGDWIIHRLQRSDIREDYAGLTDAEYANFREITTAGMGQGKLYRSSSPVRPKLNRNQEADAACAAAGIRTIINLADDTETMQSYEGYGETYYSKQDILPLALEMDFFTEHFKAGLADAFRYIAAHDGPYLIHCNEGKDRTGFICAVAEALMGAAAGEIVTDYMITYYNFYGVEPGTEQYDVIARTNIEKSIAAAFGMESIFDGGLQEKAEAYLIGVGLTEQEIALVREKLG
jgi:hypothetical protein